VLCKCALENDEYASHHSLDIEGWLTHGSWILVVISVTKTEGRLICVSTYMRVYTVIGEFLCLDWMRMICCRQNRIMNESYCCTPRTLRT